MNINRIKELSGIQEGLNFGHKEQSDELTKSLMRIALHGKQWAAKDIDAKRNIANIKKESVDIIKNRIQAVNAVINKYTQQSDNVDTELLIKNLSDIVNMIVHNIGYIDALKK